MAHMINKTAVELDQDQKAQSMIKAKDHSVDKIKQIIRFYTSSNLALTYYI
jgi:hypothetical protein